MMVGNVPQPAKQFRPTVSKGPTVNPKVGATGKINTPSAMKTSAVKGAKPLAKTVKKAVVSKAKPPRPGTGKTYR